MALEETHQQTTSRHKFLKKVKEVHDDSAGKILSLVDVALGDPGRFQAIRSKILDIINDARRDFQQELERHYVMEFVSTVRDVIVFNKTNK